MMPDLRAARGARRLPWMAAALLLAAGLSAAPGAGGRLGLGAGAPGAAAAPNPYGSGSATSAVTLLPGGRYRVVLSQSQELVRDFELTIGGAVHDGFRLPDELNARALPPYLRAGYTMTSATIDGAEADLPFIVQGHRQAATVRREFPAGSHTAELTYEVTGAVRAGSGGSRVHLRLLARAFGSETLRVDAAGLAGVEITELRCVTVPPVSVPCGRREGPAWTYQVRDQKSHVTPEFLILVQGGAQHIPPPVIDRDE